MMCASTGSGALINKPAIASLTAAVRRLLQDSLNAFHGFLVHESPVVKLSAPLQRRHISVLMHALIFSAGQAFPQRCANIRVSSMIEQKAREIRSAVRAKLANDTVEQWRVTAESLIIHRGFY